MTGLDAPAQPYAGWRGSTADAREDVFNPPFQAYDALKLAIIATAVWLPRHRMPPVRSSGPPQHIAVASGRRALLGP